MPTKEDMRNIIDYIEEPKFKSLMLELSKSNGSEDVEAIIKRYNDANGNLSEEEKELYSSNVATDIDKILKAVDDDLEALKAEKIRSVMGELGNAVSFAYIAKHYFGKSQSWLTQRLNGSKVNGKTARFNKSELIQFQNAIHDLGRKLSAIMFLYISSLFPYWEQHIPTLGMKCSHVGNKTFPSMGLFASLNERLLGK